VRPRNKKPKLIWDPRRWPIWKPLIGSTSTPSGGTVEQKIEQDREGDSGVPDDSEVVQEVAVPGDKANDEDEFNGLPNAPPSDPDRIVGGTSAEGAVQPGSLMASVPLTIRYAWRSFRWRPETFARLLFTRHAGLTIPTLLMLAWMSFVLGDMAYRNLQAHYQERMFRAVTAADVIADTCTSRSDLLWQDCLKPESRGTLSDRFAWAIMVSAKIIDPLTVPTPFDIENILRSSDKAAHVIYMWLTGKLEKSNPRNKGGVQNERGVGLLFSATTLCTAGSVQKKDPAMRTIVAAYLGDLYQPKHDQSRWLNRELRIALNLSVPVVAISPEPEKASHSVPSSEWFAPLDPRTTLMIEEKNEWLVGELVDLESPKGETKPNERAIIWDSISASATEEEQELAQEHFMTLLRAGASRLTVPDHIGDEDVVAMLFGYGNLLDPKTNDFKTDFSTCAVLTKELGNSSDEAHVPTTLANFERMALYIAGQIRVSTDVKQARFWLSVYTGHEQRLILMVTIFGVLAVFLRISVFTVLLSMRQPAHVRLLTCMVSMLPVVALLALSHVGNAILWWVSACFGWLSLCALFAWLVSLTKYQNRSVSPEDRDNDFDSVASTRWPVRLAAAILPAIGFVGTVRGIMLSLNGADAIVWAETVNERSGAISALSSDLGLAFATTLFALLGGVLLTVLMSFEMAVGERLLLTRYERRTESEPSHG